MHGICMEYAWNMYAIWMEYVTDGAWRLGSLLSKAIMDALWCVVGVSFLRPNMVVTWRRRRAHQYVRNMCAICTEYVWNSEYVWNMHGIGVE